MDTKPKKRKEQNHFAVYGETVIPRGICPECKISAFIEDGEFACCGSPAGDVPKIFHSECESPAKRSTYVLPELPSASRPEHETSKEILLDTMQVKLSRSDESKDQEFVIDPGSGEGSQCERIDGPEKDQEKRDPQRQSSGKNRRSHRKPKLSNFGFFLKKHDISQREFSSLCSRHGSKICKSVIGMVSQGIYPPNRLDKIKSEILSVAEGFLISCGFSKPQVQTELDLIFSDTVKLDSLTEMITVPAGCSANYVFKDQSGKILSVKIFNS